MEQKTKAWVASKKRSGNWTRKGEEPKRRGRVYHTDRDCWHIEDMPDRRLTEVDAADKDPDDECMDCAGEVEGRGKTERTPCPICGEPVYILPDHLPCT